MKVKVTKPNRSAKTCESMINPYSCFKDSDGIIAGVLCIAKHSVSDGKLVIVKHDGKFKAIPLDRFCVEFEKILDEGDVPF